MCNSTAVRALCATVLLFIQGVLAVPPLVTFYSDPGAGLSFFLTTVLLGLLTAFIVFLPLIAWEVEDRQTFRVVGIVLISFFLAGQMALLGWDGYIIYRFAVPFTAVGGFMASCQLGPQAIGWYGLISPTPTCDVLQVWYVVGLITASVYILFTFFVAISISELMAHHQHRFKEESHRRNMGKARAREYEDAGPGDEVREPLLGDDVDTESPSSPADPADEVDQALRPPAAAEQHTTVDAATLVAGAAATDAGANAGPAGVDGNGDGAPIAGASDPPGATAGEMQIL